MNVEGSPAVGVRVSSKGHKDVNLYFDRKTGLLVKVEHRTLDPMSGQEDFMLPWGAVPSG